MFTKIDIKNLKLKGVIPLKQVYTQNIAKYQLGVYAIKTHPYCDFRST